MAVLKNGSSGTDVKNLQTLLNKAGAKPPLKVDGDFGPLTEKATKALQKKFGLKADGKAGELTVATAKYGKKLPEMTVRDYTKRRAQFQRTWLYNRENIESYAVIEAEAAKLAEVASKEVPAARALFVENRKQWVIIVDKTDKIIAKQAEFEKVRLKDPAKAEKLARDCEDFDKQIETIGAAKVKPNLAKALAGLKKTQTKLDAAMKVIKTELAAIEKRKEEF